MHFRTTLRAFSIGLFFAVGFSTAQFSDDFNRPDGLIGNDWTPWHGYQIGEGQGTTLVNGELQAPGTYGAGGVFRPQSTPLPLKFSFDFRTEATGSECNAENFADGGWVISFNAASPASMPAYSSLAQVSFFMVTGSRFMLRTCYTSAGRQELPMPISTWGPAAGQRDFRSDLYAHIEGVVKEDLSATISVFYNDGLTPDPVVFNYPPVEDALPAFGETLILSNANCTYGPHYFDNLKIESLVENELRLVKIDVKPGNSQNTLNPRSNGVLPIAILGNPAFTVSSIEQSSLTCGTVGSEKSFSHASLEDVNADGIVDLLAHFKTQACNIACGSTSLIVSGLLPDNTVFQGTDAITTVSCKK